MQKHKIILQEYLEQALRNLDKYEDRLERESHMTSGEALYIAKRREYLTKELTELTNEEPKVNDRFVWEFKEVKGRSVMLIVDTAKDRELTERSAITEFLNSQVFKTWEIDNAMILVKDPSGVWDGWDIKAKSFIALNTTDLDAAISLYIKKQLKVKK